MQIASNCWEMKKLVNIIFYWLLWALPGKMVMHQSRFLFHLFHTCIIILSQIFMVHNKYQCSENRKIFTEKTGTITHGVGEYASNLYCEWLIQGMVFVICVALEEKYSIYLLHNIFFFRKWDNNVKFLK